ncbi:MAG: hypothetical protein FJ088_10255 [Deltaproteobacteria bacterium]|nr:hypothetical protein [Deltaproteobacteria bacterium]
MAGPEPILSQEELVRNYNEKEDFSDRTTYSYLVGVYAAINAISDAYALVDSPDCAHMKTQYIQGNHDWLSTITSVSGFHRITNTAIHPHNMAPSREANISANLTRLASHQSANLVCMTSMPMAFITGVDYERICRGVKKDTGKEVIHIPGKSLSGDWLDGYAETLKSLASQMDTAGASPQEDCVAVVGNLFDRNEADHAGNLNELRKIFDALGLKLATVWLGGSPVDELKKVLGAGAIISLPYGRQAAAILARRLNVRLIETCLPFGLASSEKFVADVAAAFSREETAGSFIKAELSQIIPKIEWTIPFTFMNRRAGFIGDPHLLYGFLEILELLGCKHAFSIVTNHPSHLKELKGRFPDLKPLVEPKRTFFMNFVNNSIQNREVDIIVTNNAGYQVSEAALLEFGFPSFFTHALYPRPFLGFGGFLAFVDSMANHLRHHEVAAIRR